MRLFRKIGTITIQAVYKTLQRTLTPAQFQEFLERHVQQFLLGMGVGQGAEVNDSGELGVFDLVRRLNKPHYCIFDVGANQGQFATATIQAMQELHYDLHSFEPSPYTFALLQSQLPGQDHVHLNNFGLGKEPGEFTLYSDAAASGMASIINRRLDHYNIQMSHTETVTIRTVDDYCDEQHINCVDLLKMDIEGNEYAALLGARKMLGRLAVNIVLFEFGGTYIDSRGYIQDFYYLFKEYGMSIYRVTPSGYLHPLGNYREILEQFGGTNYVAVRDALHLL